MEIKELQTKQDAISFYKNNLIYDRTNEHEEKNILKKYSKKEYQHLYMLIFGESLLNKQDTRKDLLIALQYYFDSIERAIRI